MVGNERLIITSQAFANPQYCYRYGECYNTGKCLQSYMLLSQLDKKSNRRCKRSEVIAGVSLVLIPGSAFAYWVQDSYGQGLPGPQSGYPTYMCDFLGYEIKDMLSRKKSIKEEEPELEKAEEQPITISQVHTIITATRR
jgi:hypothetical protein